MEINNNYVMKLYKHDMDPKRNRIQIQLPVNRNILVGKCSLHDEDPLKLVVVVFEWGVQWGCVSRHLQIKSAVESLASTLLCDTKLEIVPLKKNTYLDTSVEWKTWTTIKVDVNLAQKETVWYERILMYFYGEEKSFILTYLSDLLE